MIFLVGFPAGGSTDAIARIIADKLRSKYASTIIVDNKAGTAGRIGFENGKSARPMAASC